MEVHKEAPTPEMMALQLALFEVLKAHDDKVDDLNILCILAHITGQALAHTMFNNPDVSFSAAMASAIANTNSGLAEQIGHVQGDDEVGQPVGSA